eukprot:6834971-Prymnesium_polylepis.1
MAWFKDKGCTLPQRQNAVNAISKAIKKDEETKQETKKLAQKPTEAIESKADATTYLMCRSKQRVQTVPNLRDVAWTHSSLRAGVLIRCGCVDFCSARDARVLVDDLGVRAHIDLRGEAERPVGGVSG